MTCTKNAVAHLKMMGFIEHNKDKPNVYTNLLTQEHIVLSQGEYRPYKCEYNQRMHTLCVTLNSLKIGDCA